MIPTTTLYFTAFVVILLYQTVEAFVIRDGASQSSLKYQGRVIADRARKRHQRQRSSSSPKRFASRSSSSSTPTAEISVTLKEKAQTHRCKNFLSVKECIEKFNRNEGNDDCTVHFLDVTWFHKGDRDGRKEFFNGPRIPGSNFFDIMDIAMNGDIFPTQNPNKLYNMFPPVQLVKSALEKMGIPSDRQRPASDDGTDATHRQNLTSSSSPTTTIVICGRSGTLFAPRVWYMLKKYFEDSPSFRVCIMDGPLEEWIEHGGPIDTSSLLDASNSNNNNNNKDIWSRDLVAEYLERVTSETSSKGRTSKDERDYPMEKVAQRHLLQKNDVLKIVQEAENPLSEEERSLLIVDTRGSSYKKGHIPSAVHIPYSSLTMDDNPLQLKPRDELESLLKEKLGLDFVDPESVSAANKNKTDDTGNAKKRILLTCGSAVSVCHMALVLDELGYPHEPFIYDGSWDEWGRDPTTPKAI